MKKHLTEEEIIDYVLGTLSSDKHFIATRHLKTCHTCQQELSMWQHILEKEYIHIPSPVTKEKLMRETKQRKTRKKQSLMTALASFAAILLLVLFYGEVTKQEQVAEKNEEGIIVDENTFYPNVNVQHVHATEPNEHVKIKKKDLKKLPAVSRADMQNHYLHQFILFQKRPLCAYHK